MYTEEEAKGKWCPFARNEGITEGNSGYSFNRNYKGAIIEASCIASECMAWVWASVEVGYTNGCISKIEPKSKLGGCGLVVRQ